jgi:hypothetical protein
VTVPSLESSIEMLYQGPLADFVSARTALARTLKGDNAKRVKALQKPAAVAWAVNQVYWHARPAYDRLMKSGAALRAAQVAALGGRPADVRGAGEAHRKAIAGAVRDAQRLAAPCDVHPNADALSQTFEALSLATSVAEPDGRLTKAMSPAGFEALAGVTVKAPPGERKKRSEETKPESRSNGTDRRRQAEITKALASVAQARQAEASARSDWERRKRDLDAAEQELARLQRS